MKKINRFVAMGCAASLALMGSAGAATSRPTTITDVGEATTFEYAGALNTGTIKLTMSTSGDVYINPYNIDVEVFKGTVGSATTANNGIISPTQFIKSESDVGVKIGVIPTTTVSRSVKLAKQSDVATATAKSVGAGLQVMSVTDNTAEPTWSGTPIDLADNNRAAAPVDTGVTLARGDTTPTYAAFRVVGETKTPDGTTWSDSDVMNVSVAFSFTPQGSGSGSGTVTPDPTAPAITVTADRASYDPGTNYEGTLTLNYTNVDAGDEGNWTITWPTTDSTCKFTPDRKNVKQCAIEIDQNATAGDYDYTITASNGTDTVTTKVTLKVTA